MLNKLDFLKLMLESDVLKFGDFITKSGRSTPYFINTGNFKTGAHISKLADFYAKLVADHFESANVLFGPAYKGIPLSVATSISLFKNHNLNFNYCFNRKEAKDHGEGGNIIGHKLEKGDRLVIIEDVTTAGTSIYETMPILMDACKDISVVGLVISVDRMEKTKNGTNALNELKDKFGLEIYSIINIKEIVEILENNEINGKHYIDKEIKSKIYDYLAKYSF